MNTRNSRACLLFSIVAISLCCSQIALGETTPCNLLTQDQVGAILGVSVGAGSPIATTGCSWSATGAAKVMVTISFPSAKLFAGAKTPGAASAPTPVPGIGDEAFFTGVQGFMSLWVRKGTQLLLVRAYGLPVGDAQTKLKALAGKAVAKL
jgi:hypothetical protein